MLLKKRREQGGICQAQAEGCEPPANGDEKTSRAENRFQCKGLLEPFGKGRSHAHVADRAERESDNSLMKTKRP